MNIIITGVHIEITDAIRSYVTKKVATLYKVIDQDTKVEVHVQKTSNHHRSGDFFKTEITTHLKGGNARAAADADDLYSAIDMAQGQLFDILTLKKDKKVTLWRKGGQAIKDIIRGFRRDSKNHRTPPLEVYEAAEETFDLADEQA